jgi:hypothetical protein
MQIRRRRPSFAKLAAIVLVILGTAREGNANTIVFTSRAAFRAAVGGVATAEGWDQFASGTVIPNGAVVNRIGYSLNDPLGDFLVTSGGAAVSPPNGLGRTNNHVANEAFLPGDVVTLTFASPIVAFGVSFNSFATDHGAYVITTLSGDVVPSAYDAFPGLSTGQFAGFISSSPFSSLTIRSTVPFQFGLDDLIAARPVPEPATLILMAAGGLGLWRRRRREAPRVDRSSWQG